MEPSACVWMGRMSAPSPSIHLQFRQFDHGYAVTSHSSQGLTAGRVLAHFDTDSAHSSHQHTAGLRCHLAGLGRRACVYQQCRNPRPTAGNRHLEDRRSGLPSIKLHERGAAGRRRLPCERSRNRHYEVAGTRDVSTNTPVQNIDSPQSRLHTPRRRIARSSLRPMPPSAGN